jgi:hypothetical protein
MRDDLPIIEDVLAWQKTINEQRLGINLRGFGRFWKTVEALGIETIHNGAPEFTEIIIKLNDDVGLRLYTEPVYIDPGLMGESMPVHIRFEFVNLQTPTESDRL